MRRALTVNTHDLDVRVILDPNGDHRLEVETASGFQIARYGAEEVLQLKRAIAQYESVVIRADGGPDFYNRRVVTLKVSQ